MKKLLFILLFFKVFLPFLSAQNEVVGGGQQWSMEISNFKILEEKRNNVVVQFDVTNTGKSDIDMPYNTPLGNIEIVFDDSLKKSQYAYYQYLIKEQLADEELFLPVGLVKLDFQTEIFLPKNGVFKKKKSTQQDTNKIVILNEKIKQNSDTLLLLKKDSLKVFSPFDYRAKSKKEAFDLFKKDTSFMEVKTDTIAAFENYIAYQLFHEVRHTVVFSAKDSSVLLQYLGCHEKSDFVIDSVFIKEKTKKEVILRFLITNKSDKAAFLLGETPAIEDNISVKSYFSLLPKMTNGAIFARGMYTDKEAKSVNGALQPSQKMWLEIEIPLKLKTKFTPYIVLEINGTNTIEECYMDNNFIAVKVD